MGAPIYRGQGNASFRSEHLDRTLKRGQIVPYDINGVPTSSFLADGDYGDIVVSGSGTAIVIDPTVLSTFGRSIIIGANAGAVRGTLGLGALALLSTVSLADMANVATGSVFYRKSSGSGAPEVQTLATLKSDLSLTGTNSGDQFTNMTSSRILGRVTAGFGAAEELTSTQVRSLLSLVIGTDVQAWDADLDLLAALNKSGNSLKSIRVNAAENGYELYTPAAGGVNLADAQVDFGSTGFTDYAEVIVPAAWAGAGSNIVVSPGLPTTSDHDPEDALIEGLCAAIQSISPGVSFVLGVHAPCGTWGRYDFLCLGA